MNAGSEDNARLEGLSGILRNWESPVPCGAGIGEAELLMQSVSSAGLGAFPALGVSCEKLCELFDQNLKLALEVAEKAGPFGPGS